MKMMNSKSILSATALAVTYNTVDAMQLSTRGHSTAGNEGHSEAGLPGPEKAVSPRVSPRKISLVLGGRGLDSPNSSIVEEFGNPVDIFSDVEPSLDELDDHLRKWLAKETVIISVDPKFDIDHDFDIVDFRPHWNVLKANVVRHGCDDNMKTVHQILDIMKVLNYDQCRAIERAVELQENLADLSDLETKIAALEQHIKKAKLKKNFTDHQAALAHKKDLAKLVQIQNTLKKLPQQRKSELVKMTKKLANHIDRLNQVKDKYESFVKKYNNKTSNRKLDDLNPASQNPFYSKDNEFFGDIAREKKARLIEQYWSEPKLPEDDGLVLQDHDDE